jgi:Ca-activated chloride channel family protein
MTQGKAMRFANFETLKRIDGKRHLVKNSAVLFLRVVVVLVLVLAMADMTLFYPGQRNDFDFVIAMDVSPSMVNEDVPPDRITAAKIHAITFLNTLDSVTEVGLISFSGITYVRQQLSNNHIDTRFSLNALNISRVSGTDMAGAIVAGTNLLTASDRGRAILLFTDGVDTAGSYIDDSVEQAIAYALEHEVVIHTIGYGTEGAPVGYLPSIYNLSSSIDVETLEFIASSTEGQAFFPTTNQEADEFFTNIASQSSEAQIPFSLKNWGLLIAVLVLGIEWFLINLRFRRVT